MASVDFRMDNADASGDMSSLTTEQGCDMIESFQSPIMPVELAIKRELAYRRKIETLRLQQQTGSKKAPVPFQGPSPSPSLLGIKRKAPIGNPQYFPASQPRPSSSSQPLRNPSSNLFCKVCRVTCSSSPNLKQHREGQKHKAKLKELEEIRKNSRDRISKPQWCELCSIPCTDEISLEQHLSGKKHALRIQAIEDAKRVGEENVQAAKVKWEEVEWEMVP
ncbi:hypothetical protein HHK36_030097 [Tetracentron sinense]|uniref:C2H2-type domain-containing protein n=1 Tax=Tetracentron sinense TaxID=13715 RepID=A0A835D374_TETSI|nr:hypothetical protein HHK36_030097 [Tetracentron sinense]